jgi:dihydroflavonol-4-reductase
MDLVTGGTGFIGTHIVRALLARGRQVRCLVRPGSSRGNLDDLDVEISSGDLRDAGSLARATAGIDVVYHCAADYRLSPDAADEIRESNVAGTDHLLRSAAEAGVRRVVYTSSVGALGLAADDTPATEETPVDPATLIGAYKQSKHEAERVARDWASRGLPVVIVNPSTPVGERDAKPTPTGKMIVDFLTGKMPAYVDTGLNLVDVRDVAQGHLLAAERGRVGERYILGNRNMSLKEILDTLASITGLPSPEVRLPHWVPLAAAGVQLAWSRVGGGEPSIPLEGVRLSRHRMYFDSSKAIWELGFPQSDVVAALVRAVQWFRANGYAPLR